MHAVVSEGSRPVTWNCCSGSTGSQASSEVYAVEIWPQSDDGMKDENAEFGVEFIFAHTPLYPDEAPLVHVSSIRGLSRQHMEECAKQVCGGIEDNMGMSMMYTLVSVVQDWLNGLDMEKQEASLAADPEVLEKKRREEEEARIAALRAHGHQVTPEAFASWKKAFEDEMREKAGGVKKEAKTTHGQVTGKQWFLQQQAKGEDVDEAPRSEDDEDFSIVDEEEEEDDDIFDDDDDDDLLDQLEDQLQVNNE